MSSYGTSRRSRRQPRGVATHGLTLVEIVVTAMLFSILLVSAYQVWVGSTRHSASLEARVPILQKAQIGLTSITREIQSSRRLLYPAPGGTDQTGVGLINGQGQFVMFGLDRSRQSTQTAQPSGSVYRFDWESGSRKTILEGVLDLRCQVPVVPSGRDPDLVHVTLKLSGAGGRPVFLVTSVRLRPLDIRCPIDR